MRKQENKTAIITCHLPASPYAMAYAARLLPWAGTYLCYSGNYRGNSARYANGRFSDYRRVGLWQKQREVPAHDSRSSEIRENGPAMGTTWRYPRKSQNPCRSDDDAFYFHLLRDGTIAVLAIGSGRVPARGLCLYPVTPVTSPAERRKYFRIID